jgi:hypothetical protein
VYGTHARGPQGIADVLLALLIGRRSRRPRNAEGQKAGLNIVQPSVDLPRVCLQVGYVGLKVPAPKSERDNERGHARERTDCLCQ